MNYSDVFGLVAEYCNSDGRILPLFADSWNRWPTGPAAHVVITKLANEARFWESRRPSLANRLTQAQIAVRNHMA